MSFYRRFISYMYDYHNTKNGKNCGFLKIEVKNQKCTILFQLKNAPCRDKCNVYLCRRGMDPAYVFLQSIPVQKGTICHKIETNSQNIGQNDVSFSQCCGILCTDEDGNICSTCWDSNGSLPEFHLPAALKPDQISESSNASAENINLSDELTSPEEIITSQKVIESAEMAAEEASKPTETAAEEISVPAEAAAAEEACKSAETAAAQESSPPVEVTISEEHLQKEASAPASSFPESRSRTFPEIWEHLQKEFPSLDPFEDDTIVESIKISPSDLGYLQACNINLGSNQFLLHGYKCYHHLILGRLRGQMQYLIGVPGIYDPQEQFMSKMFGFPCFKPIRECRQKNGQFGYWIRCFR